MPDPDFWAAVRQQRDAQQPPSARDRQVWLLLKGEHRAECVVRQIPGLGLDLRYLHNGDLRKSQVYRDEAGALLPKRSARRSARRAGLTLDRWRGVCSAFVRDVTPGKTYGASRSPAPHNES